MTALTRDELLDIDPADYREDFPDEDARLIALRHAWNWGVEAEDLRQKPEVLTTYAAVSQAWSAIAEALK
jgi:hypothetical protein